MIKLTCFSSFSSSQTCFSSLSGTNDKAGGPHYMLKWASPQVPQLSNLLLKFELETKIIDSQNLCSGCEANFCAADWRRLPIHEPVTFPG